MAPVSPKPPGLPGAFLCDFWPDNSVPFFQSGKASLRDSNAGFSLFGSQCCRCSRRTPGLASLLPPGSLWPLPDAGRREQAGWEGPGARSKGLQVLFSSAASNTKAPGGPAVLSLDNLQNHTSLFFLEKQTGTSLAPGVPSAPDRGARGARLVEGPAQDLRLSPARGQERHRGICRVGTCPPSPRVICPTGKEEQARTEAQAPLLQAQALRKDPKPQRQKPTGVRHLKMLVPS